MAKRLKTSAMTIAVAGLMAGTATAQSEYFDRSKYEAVADRQQPDFDAEPIRVGSFVVNSSATVGAEATDNVFAASGDSVGTPKESDTILQLTADAKARTDWSNHEIGLRGRLGRREYSSNSDESYTLVDVGASGRLDVSRSFNLGAEVTHRDTVQPRSNYAEGALLDSPVEFSVSTMQLSANYQNDRIRWNNTVRLAQTDFEDGLLINSTTPFDQDFRDNDDLSFTTRLSYAVSPNVAFFGQGSTHKTEYDQTFLFVDPITTIATERSRDSEGYTIAAGIDFETTNLMRGDIAIGYFSEDKSDNAFADVDGLSVDGRLQWFPTQLTTVEATAARRVVDNGILNSPSTLQTSFGAKIDHELSRQVVGSLFAGLTEDDFQEINRTDDYINAGAALTYKLNKRAHLRAYYEHINRDASGDLLGFDPSFSTNEIGVALSIFP